MRLPLAAPILLALLAPVREAAAQSPPTGADVALKVTVAQKLLEEGQQLLSAGRIPEAKEKLEASLRNDPTPTAMLALGACHEAVGATASAWGEYQRAAREARIAGDKVVEAEAKKRALAIEPRLSKVKVVVTSPAPNTEVVLDKRYELGENAWGTPLPLDPGWHKLEAVAPGRKKVSTAFQVRTGEALTEVVVPALVVPPPSSPPKPPGPSELPPPEPKPTSGVSPAVVGSIVVTSVGVAGLLTGLGMLGVSLAQRGRLRDDLQALGLGVGVIALQFVVWGGFWFLQTTRATPTKSVTSIGVHPIAFSSGGGLGLHGTW